MFKHEIYFFPPKPKVRLYESVIFLFCSGISSFCTKHYAGYVCTHIFLICSKSTFLVGVYTQFTVFLKDKWWMLNLNMNSWRCSFEKTKPSTESRPRSSNICLYSICISIGEQGRPHRAECYREGGGGAVLKPQGADPHPLSSTPGKAGRNHLNKKITPLLPTGIGERYS